MKSYFPHVLVVLGFAVLSVMFMSPILNGKYLKQSDTLNGHAAQSEIRKFQAQKPSDYIGWTNSMFGGMPTFFIGADYSKGVFHTIQPYLFNLLSLQGTYIFLYLIGIYILMLSLRAKILPSVLAAIGFAFFSYNILIIEAGHLAKIYALAFVPLMLAGLVYAFRDRPWLGAFLFSMGVGLELNANHFQISYYSAFIIVVFGLFELFRAVKDKKIPQFIGAAVLCIVMGVLAIGTNSARLMTTSDYSKYTMRGGSELKPDPKITEDATGLDKDYAYEWSYGKLESLTFLIPNFSGGGSGGTLDNKSESFKAITGLGVDQGQAAQFAASLPSYWGDQQFVGGTTYVGAILCFLFILGLFFVEKRYRFPFLVSAVLCLIVSWGGNFTIINNILFDNLPFFNKFRAVSMILALFQLCVVVIAGLGLNSILTNPPTWEKFKMPLMVSTGLTAGICLLFAIMPSIVSVTSEKDAQFKESLKQSFGENQGAITTVYNALLTDRESLLSSDSWRSLILILIVAALLWAFVTQKLINTNIVGAIVLVLCLGDLWFVDKRYLNSQDFERKVASRDDQFTPTAADLQVQQDKSLSYRVLDVTGNPFNSAMSSVYHKSVGGYSAAKLSRYNDLIQNQISKNNMEVFNMLNTKYFIVAGQNGGAPVVQQNPGALGNAWFVSKIKKVNSPDEEMRALDSLIARTELVVDVSKFPEGNTLKTSSNGTGSITLTSYHPIHLEYSFDSPNDQVVAFSEIFYKGNEDWLSTIDNKPAKHFRADYVLRAMQIPAGKHKIAFSFDPITVKTGQGYDKMASIAWCILSIGAIFMHFRLSKKEENQDS